MAVNVSAANPPQQVFNAPFQTLFLTVQVAQMTWAADTRLITSYTSYLLHGYQWLRGVKKTLLPVTT